MLSSSLKESSGRSLRRRVATWAAVLSTSAMLVACTTVQTTGQGHIGLDRKQRMSPLVSEAELNASAEAAYAEVLGKAKKANALDVDQAMTQRVRAVAARLIPQVAAFRPDALKWNWKVSVIKSDELNAWCMPGGKIAFYSGIIDRLWCGKSSGTPPALLSR